MWVPFAAAVVCLAAGGFTGPALTLVLTIAALGFLLDGATSLWSKGGGLGDYRQ